MTRLRYAASQSIVGLLALFSRILNALLFGGSAHQSVSARAYVESVRTGGKWAKRRKWIDRVFFFEPEHCFRAWEEEVVRARKTLFLNTSLSGDK